VSHAFVYVVKHGETSPPEIFGKLPLKSDKQLSKPAWAELLLDASVASVKDGKNWELLQGFLLGSAAMSAEVPDEMTAQPEEPRVQFEELKLTPVYCHVDMLAARSLPSDDEDSLADPCYEVRVEDRVFKLQDPLRKTLNPTFLQRLLLGPINLPVDTDDGDLGELDKRFCELCFSRKYVVYCP